MTNKELLELINITKENNVNTEVLRQLLKLVEQEGNITSKKISLIKELLQKKEINDLDLLNIYIKAYQKRPVSWMNLAMLNNHLLIKEYLKSQDYSREEWKEILEFVSKLPYNIVTDGIYIKWLRYVYEKNQNSENSKQLAKEYPRLNELKFFHQVFKAALPTNMIYSNWYFKYLLNNTKRIEARDNVLTLLKQNIFNLINEITLLEIEIKAKKIAKCYELHGFPFASLYATIITCKKDISIPVIENDQEYEIYLLLYKTMCSNFISETVLPNFMTSLYYKIATHKGTSLSKRLEFMKNLTEKELILKDSFVYKLWVAYDSNGLEKMKLLKYAFLNNGIRTNILCKEFLIRENDLEVIKLARVVFKNNRVRKDTENLCILCDLKTSEEKIEFLQFLENKYVDDLDKQVEEEQERKIKENDLLKAYHDFFNKKIGLGKLEASLEETKTLDIELVRIRKKNNERK